MQDKQYLLMNITLEPSDVGQPNSSVGDFHPEIILTSLEVATQVKASGNKAFKGGDLQHAASLFRHAASVLGAAYWDKRILNQDLTAARNVSMPVRSLLVDCLNNCAAVLLKSQRWSEARDCCTEVLGCCGPGTLSDDDEEEEKEEEEEEVVEGEEERFFFSQARAKARYRRCRAHLRLGDAVLAAKDLEPLQRREPNNPQVLVLAAELSNLLLGTTRAALSKRGEACGVYGVNIDGVEGGVEGGGGHRENGEKNAPEQEHVSSSVGISEVVGSRRHHAAAFGAPLPTQQLLLDPTEMTATTTTRGHLSTDCAPVPTAAPPVSAGSSSSSSSSYSSASSPLLGDSFSVPSSSLTLANESF
mmetsp:Transcript_4340/g.8184  ORF Transcript_4340/g.8184 Transcript_4340/m.8184 type:complete len:360 (+) Transcript_4340:36-1115(+)